MKPIPTRLKLCLFCQYFTIDMGTIGWSELTPGDPVFVGCDLRLWEVHWLDGDMTALYRKNVNRAKTCEKFDPIDEMHDYI